jgi:cytochrome c biogenesis factor
MQPTAPVIDHVADRDEPLDKRLFVIVGVILVLLAVLFVAALLEVRGTYSQGMRKALAASPIRHEAVLAYARSLDEAFVKISALFLGFLLVFTGALYVLRIATTHYRLSIKTGQASGNLQTSSPGLVIISLGILLIIVTILTKSTLEYKDPPIDAKPAFYQIPTKAPPPDGK